MKNKYREAIQDFLRKNKYSSLQIKAAFFDMDGILFDSMPGHAKAWVEAINSLGLPFTEYEAYLNEGRTGASTIDNVFIKELGRHATDEEKQTIYKRKSDNFEALPPANVILFTKELASKMKGEGISLSVVTGSGQPSLFDNINNFYPDLFETERMITAFDVRHGKPNPEPYLMAAQKAGVRPHEAVVIENAPLGVEAGVAAGIFTIGVNTGILKPEELENAGANLVFDSMEELFLAWNDLQL